MANAPRLALPPTVYGLAFRAVTDAFRSSPLLGRVPVRTLVLWDGSEGTVAAPPTDASGPWVRVSPEAGGSDWFAVGLHRVDFRIRVETWVPGTDALQAMGLWAVIAGGGLDVTASPPTPLPSVLFPADRSLYTALQACGCRSYRVSQPDFGEYRAPDAVGIAGSGVISLELAVVTDA